MVLGCVDPVGEAGGDIARAAALVAGFGDGVPGVQINRFCASGLDAVNFAAAEVMSGQHDMTIGGGVESMSRVGIGASGGAWPVDPSIAVADLFPAAGHFRRPDRHQIRLLARRRRRLRGREPEARRQILGGGPLQEFGDDGARRQRPADPRQGRAHAALDHHADARRACSRPSCRWARWPASTRSPCSAIPKSRAINHVHTPGNSSGIVDGAAAVLIGSKEAGKAAGLKPRARIKAFANIGSEPAIMLTGPIPVTEKVLKKAGMKTSDIDLWELNEAFASVVLRYMQALDIPHDKINVNGGAIAMGHPLGATGAMILGTVLDELERTRSRIHRAGHALHRHRHGHGDDHRARVSFCPRGARNAEDRHRQGRRSTTATGYPAPFNKAVEGRSRKRLGDAAGLTQFGVNICTLKPGAASSQRHWHENEDEFVYVLEGEVVLCEDGGETVLKPAMPPAWKAGVANGHCLVNRSNRDARVPRGRHPRAPTSARIIPTST